MYILDTDHLSLIQRKGVEGNRILAKLEESSQVAVTVITYEEQVRGRLSVLSRAKTLDERVLAYRGLYQTALDYRSVVVIPFGRADEMLCQQLRKAYPRLGSMDLRIAAIVIEQNAILLTRNLSDFGKISELKSEDWSS